MVFGPDRGGMDPSVSHSGSTSMISDGASAIVIFGDGRGIFSEGRPEGGAREGAFGGALLDAIEDELSVSQMGQLPLGQPDSLFG